MFVKMFIDFDVCLVAVMYNLNAGIKITSKKKFKKISVEYFSKYGNYFLKEHHKENVFRREEALKITEKYWRPLYF